ncbi:50S ribosomal protein L3 N(5)-glutamine methyltransferase [Methylocapsa sp. S129]|uniref:50S ribosomal protein L3 N(5)-glutamine methyltransferase n=1 Tax=Methylocapsa sp. S129 TaxID=1641869 RepID=UPI00131C56B7|nr:50S ribosomal protein L3 N(5)-glutamine methyltransferase [Methylocapsa sp. S129]
MPNPATNPAHDEILETFVCLRDFFRYAVSRFNEAQLAFGHGTTNAVDEAAFLLLEALHLPIDTLDPFLDARLTRSERARLMSLIEARVATRKPAAYLVNRAYIQGEPFYVDERVIVPRSFIGELLFGGLVGEGALIENPGEIATLLDLCTGGGSLAILAARVFPHARIDAVDLSPDALAVARRNVEDHGLGARIALHEGDLFAPLGARRYDLILTNPPYVETAAVDAFPPEFAAEPRLAHEGGGDGLAIVRRILREAPGHLTGDGVLICEIGAGRARLEAEFPALPLIWLDTAESEGEVFFVHAADLVAPARKRPRRS